LDSTHCGVTTRRGLHNVAIHMPTLCRLATALPVHRRPNVPRFLPPGTTFQTRTSRTLQGWQRALSTHPDQALARYIIDGIRHGFRIGFCRGSPLKPARSNLESAHAHPEAVNDFIAKESSRGRLAGPITITADTSSLQTNRIGVVPKGHNTGKWRLITDLSFPKGKSVNDGIDPLLCSLSYTTVDQIAAKVAFLGQGTLMAKIDIESAYRLLPVHPDDRPLQAFQWDGHIYVDLVLPFGLRSAAKIFNTLADALHWHLTRAGVEFVDHYLDDYILLGRPGTVQCQEALRIVDQECGNLGVPLATHKREGPTTRITFLGILMDSTTGQLLLPPDKLSRLQTLLQEWGQRKSCTRKELESLVGHLNNACKVVRSGRSFLRRMIDLLHAVKLPPRSSVRIRLSQGFRSDLAWWQEFVAQWNGISFLPPPSYFPQIDLASDTSGSWGCGAWHQTHWFQFQWDARSQVLTIAEKELIPIILACDTWGESWGGRRVRCYCDNQVVVACLHSRTSKHQGLMHLLRCLVFVEAHHQCQLYPVYLNTRANHLADDLSRNNAPSFLVKVPHADRNPSPVSHPLLDVLLDHLADWTSTTWRHRFSAISRQV